MATGKMIKRMASAHTVTWTVQSIRATGKRTNSMVTDLKLGQMARDMRETILRDVNTDKGASRGPTRALILANLLRIISKAMVSKTLYSLSIY